MKKTEPDLYEILNAVQEIDSVRERKIYMRKNANFAVRTVLELAFNPEIELDLPEGAPPIGEDESRFRIRPIAEVLKLLPRLMVGSDLSTAKKQRIFKQRILESTTKSNREIIIAAKDKKLEELYPRLVATVVAAAWEAIDKPLPWDAGKDESSGSGSGEESEAKNDSHDD